MLPFQAEAFLVLWWQHFLVSSATKWKDQVLNLQNEWHQCRSLHCLFFLTDLLVIGWSGINSLQLFLRTTLNHSNQFTTRAFNISRIRQVIQRKANCFSDAFLTLLSPLLEAHVENYLLLIGESLYCVTLRQEGIFYLWFAGSQLRLKPVDYFVSLKSKENKRVS